ncbi:group III truncated hemoglobin [Flavobacterium sp. KACC 22758]|jgi:hemoglobin|uniref:group III truncated hemoglobin n=1 Tax=Flavobacterium sp. KACC 22758 TaxID=3025667 RepID=UPI002366F352|nr:group III truncated hemoglobin [Flavobacterium sp. KACC 22758]WDF57780.1 group III truncated hemoglobin [Flavobacterium sp. KACC 22758]
MKTDIKNKEDIKVLVDAFYHKIQTDETIGYLFTKIAVVNWEKHLPIMYDFWDNILFHTGNFDGNPMMKHRILNEKSTLYEAHFKHWTTLWSTTVDDLFEGEKADEVKIRAKNIAKAMMNKVIN